MLSWNHFAISFYRGAAMKRFSMFGLFFFILSNLCFPNNLDVLIKTEKAAIAHGKKIKTIQMDVTITNQNIRFAQPTQSKYTVLYRKKDNHYRGDYKRQAWNPDNGNVEIYEGVQEQIDNYILDFDITYNCAIFEKTTLAGFAGITIEGIMGLGEFSWGDAIYDNMDKNFYQLKSVRYIEFEGEQGVEAIFKNPDKPGVNATLRYVFVPAWQYSIPILEVETIEPNLQMSQKSRVSFQKNAETGIWFPSKSEKTMYENNNLKWTETIIYENVRLNQPIEDDKIVFKIPAGSNISNNINRGFYQLKESGTFEDILSGKIKSMQEEQPPNLLSGEYFNMRWKIRKKSVFFRLFVFAGLVIIAYIIISAYIKRRKRFIPKN